MDETIAAIATPFGEGSVGMIRISGEQAGEILSKIFVPAGGELAADRKMTYGHIVDPADGSTVDEVLCVMMRGPRTYTTEDVAEIYCHGGMVPLRRTLSLALGAGARLAERGEFTKRAFLGGRLDLSQAEAVMDLVSARADKAYDVALDQLDGALSRKIRELRAKMVDILVDLTVNIDYPDEDIEEVTYDKLCMELTDLIREVDALRDSAQTGRIMREGLAVAIVGKPNVGKSSLMNALLKESRAIVTDIPGTTRDTIEEHLNVRGIPVVLTDTAGIRETHDTIESIGIERSKESFNRADLVLLLLDVSRPLDQEDQSLLSHVDPGRTILVRNKADLPQLITEEMLRDQGYDGEIITASIRELSGIDAIESSIERRVYGGEVSQSDSLMVTNVRHKDLLDKASSGLSDALGMARAGEPLEILEIDVNSAYEALGEIIGEAVTDDILNEVFSRFCLGK